MAGAAKRVMMAGDMRDFEILFDHGEESELGEGSELTDPSMRRYGKLGFPAPAAGRPWVYANFVQTMDGIISLLGDEAGGADIAEAVEDRWLMDLLRAHADAVMLGMGTVREEQRLGRPRARGPVFRIMDAGLRQLRAKLGRSRERNVLFTAQADFQMSDYAVFDGEWVDVTVVTTREGARRLEAQRSSPGNSLGEPRLNSQPGSPFPSQPDSQSEPMLNSQPNSPLTSQFNLQHSEPQDLQRCSQHKQSTAHSWVDIIEVDEAGDGGGVDLRQAVAKLAERYGIRYLLCEAGPKLYSGMIAAGLIDEKFVTVSPMEVGRLSPQGPRPTVLPEVGFSKEEAVRWHWLSCRKVGDYQFHRFRRELKGIC